MLYPIELWVEKCPITHGRGITGNRTKRCIYYTDRLAHQCLSNSVQFNHMRVDCLHSLWVRTTSPVLMLCHVTTLCGMSGFAPTFASPFAILCQFIPTGRGLLTERLKTSFLRSWVNYFPLSRKSVKAALRACANLIGGQVVKFNYTRFNP